MYRGILNQKERKVTSNAIFRHAPLPGTEYRLPSDNQTSRKLPASLRPGYGVFKTEYTIKIS
jgi:hypothetical protein